MRLGAGRNSDFRVWLRFLLAGLLVLASILFLGLRQHDRRASSRARRMPQSATVVRQIASEAKQSSPGSRSNLQVLAHTARSGTWKLALARRLGLTCWVLVAPGGRHQGTCGPTPDVRARPFLVYVENEYRPGRSDAPSTAIVYGLISPAVTSVDLTLSDCTRIPLSLSARPLFWMFVPASRLNSNTYPVRVVFAYKGRKASTRLSPEKTAHPTCS
jgi:hypothetical protein